jgi:putative hemolysin
MELHWHWLALALGFLGSAFFSGIETGLISLNRVRLRHQVERKNRRAITISGFVENTDRLLGITLIGNNLANVIVAISATTLAAALIGPGYAVGLVATIVVSVMLVIVGEIVPKTLFRHYSFRLCLAFADLLAAVAWLFAPMVALLGLLMRAISRTSKGAEASRSFFVTREELKLLAKEGEAEGALTSEERQMIHGVFDFPHKTVYDVMVPLSRTVTVAPDTGVGELRDISQRTGFARFPVRDGGKLIGVVNVYEVLFKSSATDADLVKDYVHQSPVVFSTERIDRVLPRLRASRNPISIVVNPEGQHVGIITIEDIVEEIVGDVEG